MYPLMVPHEVPPVQERAYTHGLLARTPYGASGGTRSLTYHDGWISGLHSTYDVSDLGEHFRLWTPPIVQVGSLRYRSPLHRPSLSGKIEHLKSLFTHGLDAANLSRRQIGSLTPMAQNNPHPPWVTLTVAGA